MDVTLQRHCARYIYAIPDGLRELMSDISREVLRTQPEDIYVFIADYLDALLITRENARVAAKFVQHMSEAAETIVNLLNRTNMSRDQVDKTASIIQTAFKAWGERRGILKEDDDVVINRIIQEAGVSEAQVQIAAVVIQKAFRMYKARLQRESQLLSGIIDWRVAARSAIKLYRKTGVSPDEAKRAANLIKAAYKGYYTRKAMRQLNEEISYDEELEEEQEEEESEDDDYSSGQKPKGVRINFESVVPHVDFDDEEIAAEIIPEEQPTDLHVPTKQSTEYILEVLQEVIDCVVGVEEKVPLPHFEDKDSETDSFLPPLEEPDKPQFNKGVLLPVVSQEELEEELKHAKKEVINLKNAKSVEDVEQAEREIKTKIIEPEESEPVGDSAKPQEEEAKE